MPSATPDAREVARLVRLYSDAQERITAQLIRATTRGNDTTHLAAIRDNIAKLLSDLDAGSHQWTGEAIPPAYMSGADAAEKMLGGLGMKADFAGIHTQAAQILAENTYSSFNAVTESIGRQADDYLRAIALDAITSPLMGGRDTAKSDIFTRLAQSGEGMLRVRPDGSSYLGVQVTPGGKWWDMQTYAEMSARTTLAQTMREGTKIRLGEAGITMFIVVGGEGEGVCDECQALMDGGPYTAEEADAIDWHPNCTHSLAADPSELDALREA